VASDFKSPVSIGNSKGSMILVLKSIGFTMKEIKKLTMLQLQMYLQRHNEPAYKERIDRKLIEVEKKNG